MNMIPQAVQTGSTAHHNTNNRVNGSMHAYKQNNFSDTANDERWNDVKNRLVDPNGPYRMKQRGRNLREGVCPSCHKKTLWSKYADQAGKVCCDRESKCGYEATAKELFPDIFDPARLLKTNPATRDNPNATADAYMRQHRHFETRRLVGWYTQHTYDYLPREAREEGQSSESVTAIRFQLPAPMEGHWDRFIDGNHFGKKTTLKYGTKTNGWMWTPPDQKLLPGDQLHVEEGIFDAIAVMHAGKKVAALMGVSKKPAEFVKQHAHLGLHYIIALDNDDAGKKYTPTLVKWLRGQGENASALQPSNQPAKVDWNDLHIAGKLRGSFEQFEYWGELLTIERAKEKALLIAAHEGLHDFPMIHKKMVYWVKYNPGTESKNDDGDTEQKDVVETIQIATCLPEYLYFQKDIETRESVYYMRVSKPGTRRKYQEAISPTALGGDGPFHDRLTAIGPGLMWTGSKAQLKRYLQKYWFNTAEPNEVDCVSFLGYAKEFKTYVYKDWAIHGGQLLRANEHDYFDLPNGKQVKTSMAGDPIHLSENHDPELWLPELVEAYGNKGLMTLTSWFGSFFAEQIREMSGSYPWTELSGKPGTGKTSILKFLWKLSGRANYQGVELSKASHAGRWRSLEQAANLPIVLMEGDSGQGGKQKKGFNLEEAKGTYEGDGMRITAQKTLGNETREPKFRGALWVAQNAMIQPPADSDPDSGKAVLERICHIHWDKSHFSEAGRQAAERLLDLEMQDINGFMVHCVKHEDQVIARLRLLQRQWAKRLQDEYAKLSNDRIRFNHSQLLALAEIMVEIGAVPLSKHQLNELQAYIIERAFARQEAIEYDHKLVHEFWELYEHLSTTVKGGESKINHSNQKDFIAININHMEGLANYYQMRFPDKSELRPLLLTSKRHKYVRHNHNHRMGDVNRKCYVFERGNVE